MKTVYADNAATTALCPEALDAMVDCLKNNYGNASSLHHMGQEAAAAVLQARRDIADAIGADVNEIYFTSGGTEADNWAITNAAHLGEKKGKKHIISTTFEHHAVLHTLMKLEKEGFEVTYLDVHEDGYVRLDEFKKALRDDTCLVTIMYANNEIGTIQPIAEIGKVWTRTLICSRSPLINSIAPRESVHFIAARVFPSWASCRAELRKETSAPAQLTLPPLLQRRRHLKSAVRTWTRTLPMSAS